MADASPAVVCLAHGAFVSITFADVIEVSPFASSTPKRITKGPLRAGVSTSSRTHPSARTARLNVGLPSESVLTQ